MYLFITLNILYYWSTNRIFRIGLKMFKSIGIKFYKNWVSKYRNFDINTNISLKRYYWSEDYIVLMISS